MFKNASARLDARWDQSCSSRSPNILFSIFSISNGLCYGHKLNPYITTFNLINITITNIAINTGRLWRRPVLGQSEIVRSPYWMYNATQLSVCVTSALAFRRGALNRAARAHIVERISVYDNGADTLPTKLPGPVKRTNCYFRPAKTPATPISKAFPAVFQTFAKYGQLRT